jgi:hypothetical protein
MAIETDFAAETTTDPHYADERTAVLEPETDRTWPFYFGHLLIDWLLAAQGRPGSQRRSIPPFPRGVPT